MKLPNFYFASDLNDLRQKMGIAPDVYGNLSIAVPPGRLTKAELDKLTSVDGLDLESIDDLKILPDKTLAFKDSRVLLYIRDHTVYGSSREVDPKFHVANCTTLQEMLRQSRFKRYVVATRTNGEFVLNFIEGSRKRQELKKLSVCQNCMDALKFDGFSLQSPGAIRRKFVKEFSLDRYFTLFPKSLHPAIPEYTSENAPLDSYSPNFTDTSREFRRDVHWQCQNAVCGVWLGEAPHRKYLHLHHINGLKSDDRPENLRVLCIGCHADQPGHGHMKSLPEYRSFMAMKPGLSRLIPFK